MVICIKSDVDYFEGNNVFFKDGSSIEVDEIILATGYNYAIPFAEEFLMERPSSTIIYEPI
jgi:hypothetical protein